jgi:hypothetical protein
MSCRDFRAFASSPPESTGNGLESTDAFWMSEEIAQHAAA